MTRISPSAACGASNRRRDSSQMASIVLCATPYIESVIFVAVENRVSVTSHFSRTKSSFLNAGLSRIESSVYRVFMKWNAFTSIDVFDFLRRESSHSFPLLWTPEIESVVYVMKHKYFRFRSNQFFPLKKVLFLNASNRVSLLCYKTLSNWHISDLTHVFFTPIIESSVYVIKLVNHWLDYRRLNI